MEHRQVIHFRRILEEIPVLKRHILLTYQFAPLLEPIIKP